MEKIVNAHNILKRRDPIGWSRRGWEDNIEMDLKKWSLSVDWICLAQDRTRACGLNKMQGISWLAELSVNFSVRLFSMQLTTVQYCPLRVNKRRFWIRTFGAVGDKIPCDSTGDLQLWMHLEIRHTCRHFCFQTFYVSLNYLRILKKDKCVYVINVAVKRGKMSC
jgi:hypothetical protein